MGKHSYRAAVSADLEASALEVTVPSSAINSPAEGGISASAPTLAVVTPSAPEAFGNLSYAEYANEHLVLSCTPDVVVRTPRRFGGLFSRTRVATAALAVMMTSVSGVAIAATGTTTAHDPQATAAQLALSTPDVEVAGDVNFTVKVDGKTKKVVAKKGESLGEALSNAGIYLGANDEISSSLSSLVREDSTITISRVTTRTVTEDFVEPFGTTEENTDTLDKGETKTVSEGVDGAGKRTYTVYYRDGEEISRNVTMEIVTHKPVNKVVQVGTREKVALPSGETIPAPSGTVSGTKTDWLAAAGIPQDQWQYADFIVSRESGWNPNALNSSSGACGLAQALPCSKMGPNWNDPVVALKWQYNYVNSRYGGYAGAYAFWTTHHWY